MINKHKFARAALEENSETFVIHIAALEDLELAIHPSRTLILAVLQEGQALIKILLEFVNYAEVLSPDLAMQLLKNTGINKYAIELIKDKQPPYRPIYSLGPVELETLKAYIETYLKNRVHSAF